MEKFMFRFKSDEMQLIIAWQQFNENLKKHQGYEYQKFVTRIVHKRKQK